MTLTTFRDVPWDRPFYERAGFRVLGPDEIDQAVLAVVAREDAAGLRRAERVVVRIPLPPERIG